MTEADVALKFIEYLSDCDIYKEVPARGILDIVAVKGGIRMGLEVKVSLNFDVIWQAYNHRPHMHYSYAAAPIKNRYGRLHPAQEVLCKHLGIGVLVLIDQSYDAYGEGGTKQRVEKYEIREAIKPVLNRRPVKVELHDYMKRSVAGSQNERITAFGYFVECLEQVLSRRPDGVEVKEAFQALEFRHYKTLSLFRNSVRHYCNTGVIKNIEYRDGKLYKKVAVQ